VVSPQLTARPETTEVLARGALGLFRNLLIGQDSRDPVVFMVLDTAGRGNWAGGKALAGILAPGRPLARGRGRQPVEWEGDNYSDLR